MLSKAIAIASFAFEDKHDQGGNPYILHCLYVMNELMRSNMSQDVVIAGLLHDLIEDCDQWSLDRLQILGFSERTLELLNFVTHRENESYRDYIIRLAQDNDAIQIKLYDLAHNSRIDRLKGLRDKDFKRLIKYQNCYHALTLIQAEREDDERARLIHDLSNNEALAA